MILKFGIYNLKCCDLDKTETHTSNHLIKGSTPLEKSSSLFAHWGLQGKRQTAETQDRWAELPFVL